MEIRLSPAGGVVALSLTAAACAPDVPLGSRPGVFVDYVWAVTRGDLNVERVVRFRIVRE